MGHLVRIAKLLHGACAVTAAYYGGAAALCAGLGNGLCTLCKRGEFKYAHGPVPYNGLCVLYFGGEQLARFFAYVKPLPAGGYGV